MKQYGETVKEWDTRLERNHLMEFTVEGRTGRLYAIGSCGYMGGLSEVDLKTGRVKSLAPTREGLASPSIRERAVCGESVAHGPDSLLVVTKTSMPVIRADVPGSLLLVDGNTGRKIRSVDTLAEPVDVLTLSRP